MHTPTKSANMISATGRRPASAAPAAAPTMADSEIGVSMTRPSPNFGSSPLVTPKMPPDASRWPDVPPAPPETSSPSTMTRSSRAISWCSAWLSASRMVSCGMVACVSLKSILNVDVRVQIGFDGRRRGLGLLDGGVDHGDGFAVDGVEFRPRQRAVRLGARAKPLQAIHGLAQPRDLVLGAVVLRIAFEMAVVARDLRLDGAGALAVLGARHRAAHGIVHGVKVGAVDAFRGHAEAAGAPGQVAGPHRIGGPGMLAVAVVLENEYGGNPQHHGHVHRLEHRALIGAAVAAEGDADIAVAAQLAGDGRAHRDGRPAADDGIRAQHALGHVGDVHGAALAVAQAVLAPV